jgi:hypothetical protein
MFDATLSDEDRQLLTLRGLSRSYLGGLFRDTGLRLLRVQITYNGGYDDVPADVSQAIVEWVAYKKGLGELQAKDQSEQSVVLGQYQQRDVIALSTLKASEMDMPMSVEQVINTYQMPIVP